MSLEVNQMLYIHQLRSSLGDLMAAGRPKWFFKSQWDQRVKRAQDLLDSGAAYAPVGSVARAGLPHGAPLKDQP